MCITIIITRQKMNMVITQRSQVVSSVHNIPTPLTDISCHAACHSAEQAVQLAVHQRPQQAAWLLPEWWCMRSLWDVVWDASARWFPVQLPGVEELEKESGHGVWAC